MLLTALFVVVVGAIVLMVIAALVVPFVHIILTFLER